MAEATDDTLLSEAGQKIPALTLKVGDLLDLTSVIYGPSGSGKSTIVKHIMKILNGHIDQVIGISPTELANRSYEGYIDAPLMHYRMYLPDAKKTTKKEDEKKGALRFLEALYDRQTMMAAVYTRASQLDVLARLYARIPAKARAEGDRNIATLNKKRQAIVDKINQLPGRDDKVKEVDEKFRNILGRLYKKWIAENYALLEKQDLSEDEAYSLKYVNFNPRVLLIFDDCAAELKPFFNKEIFRKIFYQGRWCFITCIICCHDETDMPPPLRKNARLSFFTDATTASTTFEKAKMPKQTSNHVKAIIPVIFRHGNRKLVHIREDRTKRHFYHFTATKFPPFRFGSGALHDLCARVKSEGVTLDKTNPYYSTFTV
ncbi:MAG: ATP-binding protein [Patescibacteria group bacterium]|nr:ATP-binding protein [Patescibacteria group bacterium]